MDFQSFGNVSHINTRKIIFKYKNSYPNITEREIWTFEQTFEVTLPKTYKSFLLTQNGGVPDKNIFYKK